jgi:hypothetical protein
VRGAARCGLALGALLAVSLGGARRAAAEVTLIEHDGWSFFTNGRINSFLSLGYGDDFPNPTFNPNIGADGNPGPQHAVIGGGGSYFTAGYPNDQGYPGGKYYGLRIRSGFVGSILALGTKKQIDQDTYVKAYVSLWGTAESYARDRTNDAGNSTSKGFDVREGLVDIEGRWGGLVAGRQSGILGGIGTEIDFLYGHGYGVGLPCLEIYYPTCGHIGTGALGPGFAAGFVYASPSLAGLRFRGGLYDPVRLLGAWERTPYPRPEGTLTYERRLSTQVMFKLAAEGMYQYMAQLGSDRTDKVWGVSGGARLEAGPLRLGLSGFRGKGLGVYVALQNASSTFNGATRDLRYFTGVYAQSALIFGREHLAAGIGRVIVDQLPEDKVDPNNSNLQAQTGISAAFYHQLAENIVLGIDYFRFQTNWWGAPNSTNDATGAPVILPGVLPPEKQVVHIFNAGATFYW